MKGIEVKIEEEKAKSEKLILTLDAAKQEQFVSLKKENQEYLLKITSMHDEINQMNKQYEQLQHQVGHDSLKQKAITVYQRLTQVKEKRAELELSIEKAQLESGPQERARLLEQVKNDNLETSGMERKISEIQSQLKTIKEKIAVTGGELDAAEAEKQAKFEELIKKDAEMQEFLDIFDTKKDEIREQTLASEQFIVGLLQKIEVWDAYKINQLTF
jgi:intraflagellar transport protein 74